MTVAFDLPKMTNKRTPRPPYHPFGYASTGNRDLAFIRISKNASSSVVTSLGLDGWTHASGLADHAIYCALRDPVARFYSSVVETTLRARLFHDNRFYGDIVIDPEIYFEMRRFLSADDLCGYLWYIVGLIDEIGPFDAHHERQVNFLRDFRAYGYEVTFFDVANTDRAIRELLKTYPGALKDANRRQTRSNLGAAIDHARQTRVRIEQRLRARPVSPRHLLFGDEDGTAAPRPGSRAFREAAEAFYARIRAAASPALDRKIARVYAADMALFEGIARGPSLVRVPLSGLA